ncbi:nucleoside-diphosphate-sugar epimerase [Propionicimonas paludicola]|uniref:Nucleoside-diphosphate-sugar epimerase n=1 Tax=Propionicimonas paludicola TaxID=185243 RepID=A0A2A9CV25_9ACTN|nr:NAD-dependent epimerase/dehydratase family protein [Propionicimonas paludicola]PFG18274.1 nucleoside-diphosphate-sugar epimerase [Propionicimonas paludicola]
MKLLVLGGTRFVGRAVITEALDRGWSVTAIHRGLTGRLPDAVEARFADRSDPSALASALGADHWDAVVDTWSGAPRVATLAARLLRGRAGHYGYISSASVYQPGQREAEASPVVAGDPEADGGDYAAIKRGAELGILESFPDALLARPGLILGPGEDIGRLPWWLARAAAGGPMVAPGAPDRPLQYVDVRDLASWLLNALVNGRRGPVDVISRSGHATTATLLEACLAATGSTAELVWIDEERLAAAGVEPWTQLPCWVPTTGEYAGFLEADTTLAARTGLSCRPVAQTVTDTWAWLQTEGFPAQRPDRPVHGLPPELERALLGDGSEIRSATR